MLDRGHPLRKRNRSRKEVTTYFNIIVVGQRGTGKTAFVRTLCEYLKNDVIQGTFKESLPMALKDALGPTEATYSVSMEIEEDDQTGDRLALTVTDTAGVSSNLSLLEHQLRYLCTFIDHQYERTYLQETRISREIHKTDMHMHACLFFVDGDRLRQCGELSDVDRYMMRMLAMRVNVIPVVGKGDTMTTPERRYLKDCFRNDIFDIYQLPVYGYIETAVVDEESENHCHARTAAEGEEPPSNYNARTAAADEEPQSNHHASSSPVEKSLPSSASSISSEKQGPSRSFALDDMLGVLNACLEKDADNQEALDMKHYLQLVPFSVIGFEEDPNSGRPLPKQQKRKKRAKKKNASSSRPFLGRFYPWGVVDCCNPEYSDFEELITVLLSTHRDRLRAETFEQYYEKHRITRIMKAKLGEMMNLQGTTG